MVELSLKDGKKGLARAIEEKQAHVQRAEDLVYRQRELVGKFAREGLEISTEVIFLHDLENELATQNMRLARLLYQAAGLGADRAEAKWGFRP